MSRYKRYERYKDSGVKWIGEIPEHWEIKKIKYISNITMGQSPKSEECSLDETGLPFLQGNAEFTSLHPIPKIYCNMANKFSKVNDILLSVRAPVGAMNISDRVYGIGRGLCAITANKVQVRYLWYSMNVSLEELFIKSKGSTFEAVTVTDVNNLLSILPPKNEQTAIANFLDQKTAEIDGLIADKEKLIELLQEKRQAVITEAVTKGLNPNVRMKDSGIEWIGEIPEHWKVTKVKYFYDICLGKMIQPNRKDYSDTLEYYLCSINVTWDGIDISNLKEMWFSNDDKKKYSIKSGDLIVCEGGDAGRASIWDGSVENCYIQNAVHRVREKKNSLNKYLYYWLYFLKHVGYIDLICNKATIMHYTYEKFLNTVLIIPDLSEQQEISNYLDKKIAEINSLKKEIEWQIQKLKEYRQSLISEAVTGKIDVRDYADN